MPLEIEDQLDPTGENEADLIESATQTIRTAFVTGSDWTTETLLSQMRRGNIDVNPRFQRREVWTPDRKSRFIESILLNLPIPQIVLAEKPGATNQYIVLDGKQRLLTIRQYCANPASHPEDAPFDRLKLRSLEVMSELNRTSYEDLHRSQDSSHLDAFDNHTIRTVVVRNWPDQNFLYRVFLRLNTGSVPLSPQELRQALLPGPYTEFADEFAAGSDLLHKAIGIDGPDFRMRDTEVFVRFAAFQRFADGYRGDLKRFLDDSCRQLNQQWEAGEDDDIREDGARCERAIAATIDVFGNESSFSRWRDGKFDSRFNRAVFDVMTFYFARAEVADLAHANATAIRDGFAELCKNDQRFSESLATTTKSSFATAYRFVKWAETLQNVLGVSITAPAKFVSTVASDALVINP